jgi:hypothetical protein
MNSGRPDLERSSMARFIFVVGTNPVAGRAQEYNEWYDSRHLQDTLGLPGVIAARRYRLADMDPKQQSDYEYLAIYEIESDDINEMPKVITGAIRRGDMPTSAALDRSKMSVLYYELINEGTAGNSNMDPLAEES